MNQKRRIHDAIVGIVVTAGVALGHYVSAHWLILPAVIGVTLMQSGYHRVVSGLLPARPSPPLRGHIRLVKLLPQVSEAVRTVRLFPARRRDGEALF